MAFEFKTSLRVQFSETDLAGIVHFSNYFRYMEVAEHAFFRSLGYSIHAVYDGRAIGWPRVKATCEYRMPLRFEDEVEVHLIVRDKKRKSLTYEFTFRKPAGESGEAAQEVAHGSVTVVCVTMDEQTGRMKATEIPDAIYHLIEVAPSEETKGAP